VIGSAGGVNDRSREAEVTEQIVDIPIAQIVIGDRFRKELGDITGLAASIEKYGLLQPIIVSADYGLIVGQRRLTACETLGRESILARVVSLDDPLGVELDENATHKSFTVSERYRIGEAMETRERAKAEERMQEGQKSGGRGKKKLGGNLPPSLEEGKSRDIIAARVGWSGKTYDKAKAVVQAAQKDEDYEGLVEKMDRTGNVDAAYRQLPEHLRLQEPTQPRRSPEKKPPSLETMLLQLDRCMEKVLPGVRALSTLEYDQLVSMLQHFIHLTELDRKDADDDVDG
jgi:ParB-like chromosome segregation protein Spo0J